MLQVPPRPLAATPDEASWRYRGWRVVIACFTVAMFAWGFGFYGHGVFLAELRTSRGWPAALISGATTLYYFVGALAVVYVSDAIRRFGPRSVMLAGVLMIGAAAVLVGIVTQPWQLYAAYLVMSAGWAATTVGAISNVLGLWFSTRRGLAINLALNGASFAGVVVIPALVLLVGSIGFEPALIVLVGAMLVLILPMLFFWVDRPAVALVNRPSLDAAGLVIAPWTRAEALRSWRFWSIALPFALALMAQAGFLVHEIAILEPSLGRAQAGAAVALTTAMAIVGRLTLGMVIDRFDQRVVTAASLASQIVALTAMILTRDPLVLFAAVALFGFSVGNLITFPALIVQREFEPASFGMLTALVSSVWQIGASSGPLLLGAIHDLAGAYTAPIYVCGVLDLGAAAVILMRPRTLQRRTMT
ncbi:MAG: MFS transporter [Methylobacteriaceae bacterium]|nr:MFS transporter [Methylobacteriaceae bacterium]